MNQFLYFLTRDIRFLDMETIVRWEIAGRFPGWITFFLCVACVVLAWYAYYRSRNLITSRKRYILTTLRALAYLAILFIIAAPRLKVEGEGGRSGPLPVVLDHTESMSIEDVSNAPRLDAALKIRDALTKNAGVEPPLRQVHYLYGEKVLPLQEKASDGKKDESGDSEKGVVKAIGTRTSIRDMIVDSMNEHRGSYSPGILLITDGANNVSDLLDSAVDDLKKRRAPLYILPIGQEKPKDISLEYVVGDDIIFVNEKAKFFISMTQNGFTDKQLRVQCTFGTMNVQVPDYTPKKEGNMTIPVEFKPTEEGLYDFVAQVPPDSEESTAENNKVSRRVRVIKDRIRILTIFGEPSWEFRFLQGAFERDHRVDFKVFLQSIDKRMFKYEQARLIPNLPTDKKEFFKAYDIVFLSRIDLATLPKTFIDNLHAFVSDEGGGLVIQGDGCDLPFSLKGTALEPALPVRLTAMKGPVNFSQEMFKPLDTPYFLDVTEDGQTTPVTTFDADPVENQKIWRNLPASFELVTQVEAKPSTIPLVNAFTKSDGAHYPAVAYHNYGKGTVLYTGFDTTWRWRKIYGDRYFRDFWGRVVQFLGLPHLLGASAQARIFLDRLSSGVGDKIIVTASIRNRDYTPYTAESVPVNTTFGTQSKSLDLKAVKDRPGMFRASYYPEVEGKHVFNLPAQFPHEAAELEVSRLSREYQDAGVKFDLLSGLVQRTGGLVFPQTLTIIPASGTNIPPSRAVREQALAGMHDKLVADKANMFNDASYVSRLADHILHSISENRTRLPILVDLDLWDYFSLLTIAALLFCSEYTLRKLWYLD